jgi:hypothetical protein
VAKKYPPKKAVSRRRMGKARHPRGYKKGPRKQMTPEWKKLVLMTLEANERANVSPRNIPELADMIPDEKCEKGGIHRMLKSGQVSSVYVDDICDILKIPPPLVALASSGADSELERDLDVVRRLPREFRREWIDLLLKSEKK